MYKRLKLDQEVVFSVFIDLIVSLLNKFLKQMVELHEVIPYHGTILSVEEVSFFGIFAGWKIINWVQIVVFDSAFKLGFRMVDVFLS
jgi:hypothetical protein